MGEGGLQRRCKAGVESSWRRGREGLERIGHGLVQEIKEDDEKERVGVGDYLKAKGRWGGKEGEQKSKVTKFLKAKVKVERT